jgi:dihydroorotase
MMVHIDHPPPTLEDVLARLRPGDILTHCFRPFPNNPAAAAGGVRDAVIEARKRGFSSTLATAWIGAWSPAELC